MCRSEGGWNDEEMGGKAEVQCCHTTFAKQASRHLYKGPEPRFPAHQSMSSFS